MTGRTVDGTTGLPTTYSYLMWQHWAEQKTWRRRRRGTEGHTNSCHHNNSSPFLENLLLFFSASFRSLFKTLLKLLFFLFFEETFFLIRFDWWHPCFHILPWVWSRGIFLIFFSFIFFCFVIISTLCLRNRGKILWDFNKEKGRRKGEEGGRGKGRKRGTSGRSPSLKFPTPKFWPD